MSVGSLHRIISSLFGDDWRPLEVFLVHAPPRNRRYYRTFFRCNVTFNAEFNAILLDARDLDRPIPNAHPLIAHYLRQRVEAIKTRSSTWDDKVAELVRSLLPAGDCSIERVASHMACDRRTIHRTLPPRCARCSALLAH